jgi:hypothetical protein
VISKQYNTNQRRSFFVEVCIEKYLELEEFDKVINHEMKTLKELRYLSQSNKSAKINGEWLDLDKEVEYLVPFEKKKRDNTLDKRSEFFLRKKKEMDSYDVRLKWTLGIRFESVLIVNVCFKNN